MKRNEVIEAFDVIRRVNNLKHLRDNIYINEEGIHFYLDNRGFHTTVQFPSSQVLTMVNKLKTYKAKLEEDLITQETVGKRTKTNIVRFINDDTKTPAERILLLKKYFSKTFTPNNVINIGIAQIEKQFLE